VSTPSDRDVEQRFKWLPPMGSWKFHLLLGCIAIFILGPLGGVTATYMNFSLGFFVGGQVLAGILGSAVTYGYGAEGKHGANYMQTLAASVASMAGMAVLIQAMHWLGFEVPEAWKLIVYYLCIGMFGVGVGMLYTPILVDKMQLTYPSGFAVANILRALTDKVLLKMSIGKLALGTFIGLAGGLLAHFIPLIAKTSFSGATFGAGMVVGVRIALPAVFIGLLGDYVFLPMMVDAGWLQAGDPFRKLGFVVALGAILGAAIVDITLVGRDFVKHLKTKETAPKAAVEEWKKVNSQRLLAWIVFWGAGVFLVATQMFGQEPLYVLIAIALVFVFMLVNGISLGISDSNPISSAFVLTVLVLASLGLGAATGGLICASILLISVSIGGDMQQDRSTGWRLGTNRVNQFRYQVIGVTMGAILAVGMASFFMTNNPSLYIDQTDPKAVAAWVEEQALAQVAAEKGTDVAALSAAYKAKTATADDMKLVDERKDALKTEAGRWQSAMTYKFVGALDIFIGRPAAISVGTQLGEKEISALVKAIDNPSKAYVALPAGIAQKLPALKEKALKDAGDKVVADKQAAMAEAGKKTGAEKAAAEKAAADKETADKAALPQTATRMVAEALAGDAETKPYAAALMDAEREKKKGIQIEILLIGINIGMSIEIIRKLLRASKGYQSWKKSSKGAYATDFVLDVTIFASPYASSFGGFVDLITSFWFSAGGTLAAATETFKKKFGKKTELDKAIPEDMSPNSLIGGGLIAGESLFYLFFGLISMMAALL